MRILKPILWVLGAVVVGLGIVAASEKAGWIKYVPKDQTFGASFDAGQVVDLAGSSSTPVWLPPDFNGTAVTPTLSRSVPYAGMSGIDLYLTLIPSSTTSTLEFIVLASPDGGSTYFDTGTTTNKTQVNTQPTATTTYASNPYTVHRWQISSDNTDYQFRYIPLEFEGPTNLQFFFRYGQGTSNDLRGGRVWVRGVLRENND